MDSGSGSNRKGKRKTIGYGRDLKSNFIQRSSNTASTHGSGVGLEALEREEVVLQTQVESTDAVAVPMSVEDVEGQAGGGVDSSREQTQDKDASDQGIITEFNPEHVISDPGLHIPIDQFGPNIRDEVRRAFKQKGPTQSSCHNFPKGRDKRSFQKDWFKQYNWLKYSLEKGRAYCFYCYLFRNGKDDWYKLRNEEVRQAYIGFPKNAKMTSGTIQKEIAECCAEAVTKVIKEEMDGCLFSILVDESRDILVKEQMAIVVR